MKSENSKKERKARREFTPEFKREAIELTKQPGQTISKVAKNLDLTESTLRIWVRHSAADAGKGLAGTLATTERQELADLRKENRILKMEREILRKAAAFFAKEQM